MLQGNALKEASRRLAADLRARMAETQHGVGTFADHVLLAFIAHLEQGDEEQGDESVSWEDRVAGSGDSIEREALQRLQRLVNRREQGRFVEYPERAQAPDGVHGNCDVGYFDMVMSQGEVDCLQWKGRPLFKTVYDVSLYPMLLWALKPKTIIELGSGTGASAIWLADLAAMFGIGSHVHSVDLQTPAVQHEPISFIKGDCETIADVLDEAFLRSAPHPWMVIEDAHVNVLGVLRHLHPYIRQGDYVVVEDSAGKQDEIRRFLSREPDCYKVDTYYTDFFGRNATCAQDSILVRT